MNVNRQMAKLSVAALVAAGAVLAPTAANAASAGGGTWTWGTDAKHVWSQYNHPKKTHMSWVKNLAKRKESGRYAPGRLATATLSASFWGNEAGWGVY